mmetsp:Transcript_70683/g.218220  ORF Transcript_70683/g.218220 Transcript_70683/m.218220 type:complete len:269 (+) Transcript_70683:1989-2795(+)
MRRLRWAGSLSGCCCSARRWVWRGHLLKLRLTVASLRPTPGHRRPLHQHMGARGPAPLPGLLRVLLPGLGDHVHDLPPGLVPAVLLRDRPARRPSCILHFGLLGIIPGAAALRLGARRRHGLRGGPGSGALARRLRLWGCGHRGGLDGRRPARWPKRPLAGHESELAAQPLGLLPGLCGLLPRQLLPGLCSLASRYLLSGGTSAVRLATASRLRGPRRPPLQGGSLPLTCPWVGAPKLAVPVLLVRLHCSCPGCCTRPRPLSCALAGW